MCPKRPYRRYAPLPPLRRGKLICRKPKASPAKAGEGDRAAVVGALLTTLPCTAPTRTAELRVQTLPSLQ